MIGKPQTILLVRFYRFSHINPYLETVVLSEETKHIGSAL